VTLPPPGEKSGLVPAALFQRQCIALLAEVQLLQKAHSEQDIFPAESGVDAGADRAYPEIAEPDFVQQGLPGPDRRRVKILMQLPDGNISVAHLNVPCS